MRNTILDARQQHEARLQGFAASLTRVGRAMTGRQQLQARVASSDVVPAYTFWESADAPRCVLGSRHIKFLATADYVRGVGLFHHEQAHVMFTPSQFVFSVQNQYRSTFNILEDARIERLLVGMYPSVKPYLQAIVAHFILTTGTDQTRASGRSASEQTAPLSVYPLVVGRTYLPKRIRERARQEFVTTLSDMHASVSFYDYCVGDGGLQQRTLTPPKVADYLRELVYEYLTFILPTTTAAARKRFDNVVATVHAILSAVGAQHADANHIGNNALAGKSAQGDGNPSNSAAEAVQKERQQRDAQKKAAAQEADEGDGPGADKSEKSDGEDADAAGGADGDDGNESGSGSGDEKSDGQGKGGKGKSDDDGGDSDASGDDGPANGAGGGDGDHDFEFDDSMRDLREMSEALAEALTEEYGSAAVKMTDEDTKVRTVEKESIKYFSPTVETMLASQSYAREIRRLTEQVDPGWEKRTSYGKLNVQRAMTGSTAIDELFDSWDEGKTDETRVETVILIDKSWSMKSSITAVCEQAWSIKRAADSLRHPCTVVVYDDQTGILWPATEKVGTQNVPGVKGDRGTRAYKACVQAGMVFDRSRLRHKVLIVLSDGDWQDRDRCIPVIKRMNECGVQTVMVSYSPNQALADTFRGYGFEHVIPATSPSVLADVARATIRNEVMATVRGQQAARRGARVVNR